MSYEQARKDLQGHFANNFTELPSTKIAWDNVEFTPPNNSEWIRVSMQNVNSEYVSIGESRNTRRFGLLFFQIFIPENSQTLKMTEIIDKIVEVFETKTLSGFTFDPPNVNEVGITENWFQTNISVSFYYDEVISIS